MIYVPSFFPTIFATSTPSLPRRTPTPRASRALCPPAIPANVFGAIGIYCCEISIYLYTYNILLHTYIYIYTYSDDLNKTQIQNHRNSLSFLRYYSYMALRCIALRFNWCVHFHLQYIYVP